MSFVANSSSIPKEFLDKNMCVRSDGRDLIKEWIKDKKTKKLSHQYLANLNDIQSLDTERTDYILGRWESFNITVHE